MRVNCACEEEEEDREEQKEDDESSLSSPRQASARNDVAHSTGTRMWGWAGTSAGGRWPLQRRGWWQKQIPKAGRIRWSGAGKQGNLIDGDTGSAVFACSTHFKDGLAGAKHKHKPVNNSKGTQATFCFFNHNIKRCTYLLT
ncbi:hypothetical protein GN956_G8586 [Arapaima gigas]